MVRILGVVVVVLVLPLFAWLILPAAVLVVVAAVPATPIALAIATRTSLADDDSDDDDDEDEAVRRAGRLRRAELRASRRKCRLAVGARRPAPLGAARPGRAARPRSPWSFPTRP